MYIYVLIYENENAYTAIEIWINKPKATTKIYICWLKYTIYALEYPYEPFLKHILLWITNGWHPIVYAAFLSLRSAVILLRFLGGGGFSSAAELCQAKVWKFWDFQ